MLYAHWEGWVKALARLYIAYVDQQKLRYDDLNEAFLGIALRTRLEMIGEAKAAATHNDFASFVIGGGLASPAPLSLSVVRTEGNLSSAVMRDIVTRLGVPYQPYELFAALIDERLVRARNTIAHGDHLEVTVSSYEDLHARVIRMLNAYTIDVLNAAATQAYRRPVLPATSPAP